MIGKSNELTQRPRPRPASLGGSSCVSVVTASSPYASSSPSLADAPVGSSSSAAAAPSNPPVSSSSEVVVVVVVVVVVGVVVSDAFFSDSPAASSPPAVVEWSAPNFGAVAVVEG